MLLALLQTPDDWVRRLGDEEYAAREEAMAELAAAGKAAWPAIERGCGSRDPEVEARCRWLLRPVIRPGVTIDIEVVGEPEMSVLALFVPPDGYDYLPYIGRVQLAGKTRDELREDLETRYRRILKRPQVVVRFRGTDRLAAPGTLPWNPPF